MKQFGIMDSPYWETERKNQVTGTNLIKNTIYLDPDVSRNIDILSAKMNKSRSSILSNIILEWLIMFEQQNIFKENKGDN